MRFSALKLVKFQYSHAHDIKNRYSIMTYSQCTSVTIHRRPRSSQDRHRAHFDHTLLLYMTAPRGESSLTHRHPARARAARVHGSLRRRRRRSVNGTVGAAISRRSIIQRCTSEPTNPSTGAEHQAGQASSSRATRMRPLQARVRISHSGTSAPAAPPLRRAGPPPA